ncbi:unnamed protein product [Ectocarpus sp. CCAP 1310/34]|nr:unnamed protein product [Ectocarpus sp. CCAP 1310/34]
MAERRKRQHPQGPAAQRRESAVEELSMRTVQPRKTHEISHSPGSSVGRRSGGGRGGSRRSSSCPLPSVTGAHL